MSKKISFSELAKQLSVEELGLVRGGWGPDSCYSTVSGTDCQGTCWYSGQTCDALASNTCC
jgi:hypothetical protein